ncbi:MAG: archaetidylserine decarboxylase [Pseudomonadota bacterium]
MSDYLRSLTQHEQINFLLTNRIPRTLLTRFMGWFSKIESPLLTKISLYLWQQLAGPINLDECKNSEFNSLHECFIRELKKNARAIDKRNNIIISPCDAVIGSFGKINDNTLYQAKGFPYDLHDLIPDKQLIKKYKNGLFITLRLKSTMYHRFHAPVDCHINNINYITGDTWNVNPIALKRIEKLYCKNERAVLDLDLNREDSYICIVAVAAILVASMKFNCLNKNLDLKYQGPNSIPCSKSYLKGEEIGYFQHGSTIILFASSNYRFTENLNSGDNVKMGEQLLIEV